MNFYLEKNPVYPDPDLERDRDLEGLLEGDLEGLLLREILRFSS